MINFKLYLIEVSHADDEIWRFYDAIIHMVQKKSSTFG